jgi:type I restriction enzyme M protein
MISEREDVIASFEEDDKSAVMKDDDDTAIDSKKFKVKLKEVKGLKKKGIDIDEDFFEEKILKIADLDENIKAIKNEIKDIALKLETDTKQYIETVSDEDAIALIEKKWISVLCDKINDLPNKLITDFVSMVMKLIKKYETTLTAIDTEISEVEGCLAEMLDELTGDEFDMKGISAFKALLLGE